MVEYIVVLRPARGCTHGCFVIVVPSNNEIIHLYVSRKINSKEV